MIAYAGAQRLATHMKTSDLTGAVTPRWDLASLDAA